MTSRFVARHGAMRQLGEFECIGNQTFHRGERVILRSQRGTEPGDILCEASERTAQLLKEPVQGQIVRAMTTEDVRECDRLHDIAKKEFAICLSLIRERKLQMELVDVEHLLGGERAVFYFVVPPPEKRVDFRDLVRDLARDCQTRIEMRQIGIRDEARLLADYGDCGKPVCCNTHMTSMPPVSMRMAKLQKSTLDPTKISGRCGRLKCCLRFEQDVYEEFVKELPNPGTRILTRKGQGRVIAQEILARKLLVEFEDGRRLIIEAEEVLTRIGKAGPPPREQPPAGPASDTDQPD